LENGKCLINKSTYRYNPETIVNKKSLNFYHSFNFQKNEHLLHQIVSDAIVLKLDICRLMCMEMKLAKPINKSKKRWYVQHQI